MSYSVFQLIFGDSKCVDHVGLFVATVEEPRDKTGILFHVMPDLPNSTGREVKMNLSSKQFSIQCSVSLSSTKLVGTILKGALKTFKAVCIEVGTPSWPAGIQNHPDCVSWVRNAIYDLKRKKAIHMNPDFATSSQKVVLNIPARDLGNRSTDEKAKS